MERNPEILGDLWALYRLDFWEAITSPRVDVLMECVKRLSFEPHSLWRANMLGGEKWFGWGLQEAMTADLIDALNFNTSATAVNKKAKPGKPVERPQGSDETRTYQPKSVKETNLGAFFSSIMQ